MALVKGKDVQYETYYNGRFDFAIAYPQNLIEPLPPQTSADGRKFVSPEGDIEMVARGSHQHQDRSLREIYLNTLKTRNKGSVDVTYNYLGDREFVISGYDSSGNVFYSKTLLRHSDLISLSLNYDRSLEPEFDLVVADIANSLRSIRNERQVSIYFPKRELEPEDGVGAVAPVIRTTDRIDIAEFALEQLLQGPTEAEQYFVSPLSIEIEGESNCGDLDFTVSIGSLEEQTAIVRFCRHVAQGGLGSSVALENAIHQTLKQFSTIDEVVILDRNGHCLIDFEGGNECLEKLPNSSSQVSRK